MDDNWIPVNERLPDGEIGRYLVTSNYENKYKDTVFFSDFYKGKFINLNGFGFSGVHDTVIAWMEVPEGYNGR